MIGKPGRFFLVLCLALVLSVAATARARPVRAATCVSTYTVKEGDTTTKIAQTHRLKWKQIVLANNLKSSYRLTAGDQLCIPPEDAPTERRTETDSISATTKLTVTGLGGTVQVRLANLSKKGVFYVKVRPTATSVGNWDKLGLLKIDKNETVTATYRLPRELDDTRALTVCLKNGTTDEVVCENIFNP